MSEVLVDGAVDGAQALGVSDAVIGLTVVAVGTSAPELVTTLVSTVRASQPSVVHSQRHSALSTSRLVSSLSARGSRGSRMTSPLPTLNGIRTFF